MKSLKRDKRTGSTPKRDSSIKAPYGENEKSSLGDGKLLSTNTTMDIWPIQKKTRLSMQTAILLT